jgi:hypothetical protein
LENRDTSEDISLEAHILVETTARGQGIPYPLCHGLIMHLPFIGRTQADVMYPVTDADILDLAHFLARLP